MLSSRSQCSYAGHRDWRIPNVKELQSIVDYSQVNPALALSFPGSRTWASWAALVVHDLRSRFDVRVVGRFRRRRRWHVPQDRRGNRPCRARPV